MTTTVGNFVIFGDIEQKWLALGGLGGHLGQPTTNETPTFDGVGREQRFQQGFIAWHPDAAVKAHVVWGSIGARWDAIGREQFGYPVTDESDFPGGGKYNTFRAMQLAGHPEASIVWKPGTTAAWEVYGAIRQSWINTGSVSGPLHYPIDQERAAFDNRGRFQHFEGGLLSWHPDIPGGPFIVWGSIAQRWIEVGREKFGYPTCNEMTFPDGGKYNTFRAMQLAGHPEAGIVWKPGTANAWEVYGAIRQSWINNGSVTGVLHYPIDQERPAFDNCGRFQHFEGGILSWHPDISGGPFMVHGSIGKRWIELGREVFGYPVTNEMPLPDGGKYNTFRAMQLAGHPEACIVWQPADRDAWEVYGDIYKKWIGLGGASGVLGYPVQNEQAAAVGGGRYQHFQHGIVTWHPETGAHAVYGSIGAHWLELGRESFGYPITDESPAPDGQGRFNHFRALHVAGKPEASIYWTKETGAHEVYGAIRERWAKRGCETSNLGYPIAAECDRTDRSGREQRFQHGCIVWSSATGALFDPLVFTAPIKSGGLAALGGDVRLTINLDGSMHWQGHAHDSGIDGYDFEVAALVRIPAGRNIAKAHGGRVTSGSREDRWDEWSLPSVLAELYLPDYNDSQLELHVEYASDIASACTSFVNWLLKVGIGCVSGPAGTAVFIGLEAGSLISTGSLVPGARIAEGVLWMAGPGNTLLAIVAEGIASLGSRTTEVKAEWYDWANEKVFQGVLPPRDWLVLTDTIGGGNRAFTFPRYDEKITLNMGPGGYDDPRNYPGLEYGQAFIHELVHACQIYYSHMDLLLLADAFASKVCEATGGDPYAYGPAGPPYGSFNLEERAQIVSDWFAGYTSGQRKVPIASDPNSPYYRYITDNVRLKDF